MKVLRGINLIICFFIGNTIGRLFYKKEYLRGRHFNGIRVNGWRWVTRGIFFQKILGYNREVPWPVSEKIYIGNYRNIQFDINDMQIFHVFGTYYQAWDKKIYIGKGSYIAPNVGIITSNHDFKNLDKRGNGEDIVIGEKNWIGMNSVILPGVKLGDNTIVGAGSVVTKSFNEGNCIIAGNPAKKIRNIEE